MSHAFNTMYSVHGRFFADVLYKSMVWTETEQTVNGQLIGYVGCCVRKEPVKVGFHYPSSRAEFTGRVHGPRTRVHFLTPVNSGRELG